MADILAGAGPVAAVVLAAGAGVRLRPLTFVRPKALCPVGNVALVDLAVARARAITPAVAVNAHHLHELIQEHLAGQGVHVEVERPEALGTAGALGNLRRWIDGRDVILANVDAWHNADLRAFIAGWDGRRPRLLTVRHPEMATWGDLAYAGVALLPWSGVSRLPAERSGLWELWWRRLQPGRDLELVDHRGRWFDCGTPSRYLAANLAAGQGGSVVGDGAIVEGRIERSVIWPGARVWKGEWLGDAIRAGERMTVLVR